jgi:hypothetical protein
MGRISGDVGTIAAAKSLKQLRVEKLGKLLLYH